MQENATEKRQFKRVRSRLPIEYRNLRSSDNPSKGTLIKDIGEGGIRFISDEFLSLANRLILTLTIPTSARPIKAISKVAWIKKLPSGDKYEIGNQFLEINRDDREEVAKYVKTVVDLDINI